MGRLPPPPAGVGHVDLEIDVNGRACSVGWWIFVPNGSSAGIPYAEELIDYVLLAAAPSVVDLLHHGAALVACHIQLWGVTPARVRVQIDPAHGPWEGGQAQNVALGIHWLTETAGRGRQSTTRLPAVPDLFIDGNTRVSGIGYANVRDKAASFLTAMNAAPGPFGGTVVLGTLHRIANGVPLSPPTFDPFVSAQPSDHVLTLRRRLPRSHAISSA